MREGESEGERKGGREGGREKGKERGNIHTLTHKIHVTLNHHVQLLSDDG